jgi:CDGSH-type Zn-finger protein
MALDFATVFRAIRLTPALLTIGTGGLRSDSVSQRLDRTESCCQNPDSLEHTGQEDHTIGRRLMADVTIEARPNGPYIVTGTIELRDTNGNVIATQARTVLCRCGASTKKPFCDGTHSKIGFQAAAEAVPGSAEKT